MGEYYSNSKRSVTIPQRKDGTRKGYKMYAVIGGVTLAALLGGLGWIIKMLVTILAQTAAIPGVLIQIGDNTERIRALELAYAGAHPDLYSRQLKVRPIGDSTDGKT